ncbi:Transcriptional activator hap5, variant 2 [Stygiomarasmius scandens]
MISADAPILLCKACEIFISEITARTFIISDSNKRRTLSRSDIATALSKSDQFDFLLDIVPRDIGGMRRREMGDGAGPSAGGTSSNLAAVPAGFNAGGGDTGMGQTSSGAGNKVDGLQDLQAFDEQTGSEDQGGMRRTGDGSGDVLKELEYLLDKPTRISAAVPSDVVRLS